MLSELAVSAPAGKNGHGFEKVVDWGGVWYWRATSNVTVPPASIQKFAAPDTD
jgi:hypothetical protein